MFVLTPEAGVPDFICENPSLIYESLGDDPRLTLTQAVNSSYDFVSSNIPAYDRSTINPLVAIETNTGSCFSRASLLHGIFSSLPHLQSGIIITDGHAKNVVVERQGLDGTIVDNSRDYDEDEDEDIGVIYIERRRAAVSTDIVRHDLDGSLVTHTHEHRDAEGGLISLWRATEEDARFADISEEKPPVDVIATLKDLRPYSILLGKSATHLVNNITGHRRLKTGTRAQDVLKGLEALKSPDTRKSSTITVTSPLTIHR